MTTELTDQLNPEESINNRHIGLCLLTLGIIDGCYGQGLINLAFAAYVTLHGAADLVYGRKNYLTTKIHEISANAINSIRGKRQ